MPTYERNEGTCMGGKDKMKLTEKQYAFIKEQFGIDKDKFDAMSPSEKKKVGLECYYYEADELSRMDEEGIDIDNGSEYSDDLLSAMQLVDLLV